ncbi:MAG: hypothetical protein K2X27_28125 [Candidatus Obscuribacterales bacterium]|nr:hypothetical protein [Candidatus Obscuribacterales bacterium]
MMIPKIGFEPDIRLILFSVLLLLNIATAYVAYRGYAEDYYLRRRLWEQNIFESSWQENMRSARRALLASVGACAGEGNMSFENALSLEALARNRIKTTDFLLAAENALEAELLFEKLRNDSRPDIRKLASIHEKDCKALYFQSKLKGKSLSKLERPELLKFENELLKEASDGHSCRLLLSLTDSDSKQFQGDFRESELLRKQINSLDISQAMLLPLAGGVGDLKSLEGYTLNQVRRGRTSQLFSEAEKLRTVEPGKNPAYELMLAAIQKGSKEKADFENAAKASEILGTYLSAFSLEGASGIFSLYFDAADFRIRAGDPENAVGDLDKALSVFSTSADKSQTWLKKFHELQVLICKLSANNRFGGKGLGLVEKLDGGSEKRLAVCVFEEHGVLQDLYLNSLTDDREFSVFLSRLRSGHPKLEKKEKFQLIETLLLRLLAVDKGRQVLECLRLLSDLRKTDSKLNLNSADVENLSLQLWIKRKDFNASEFAEIESCMKALIPEQDLYWLQLAVASSLLESGKLEAADKLMQHSSMLSKGRRNWFHCFQAYLDMARSSKPIPTRERLEYLLTKFNANIPRLKEVYGAESSQYAFSLWSRACLYYDLNRASEAMIDLNSFEKIIRRNPGLFPFDQKLLIAKKNDCRKALSQNQDL